MKLDRFDLYSLVGRMIKKTREDRGLTQDALASMVSLTRSSISNIEKGRQKLLLHTLCDIAAVLQVAPAQLLPTHPIGASIKIAPETKLDDLLKDYPPEAREWVKATITSSKKEA